MGSIPGSMVESMKDNGNQSLNLGTRTKCMARDYTSGTTEGNTKANTSMIRNTAMESTPGQMGGSTTAAGQTGSGTGEGNTS